MGKGRIPPIIFLDFDGVIMTAEPTSRYRVPDPRAIKHLNQLVRATGGFVVISSTWRNIGLGRCRAILRDAGFTGKPIGATPSLLNQRKEYCRGDEIVAWLRAKGQEHRPIIILDDDHDMGALSDRLIRTKGAIGLASRDVHRAIGLWRGNGDHADAG